MTDEQELIRNQKILASIPRDFVGLAQASFATFGASVVVPAGGFLNLQITYNQSGDNPDPRLHLQAVACVVVFINETAFDTSEVGLGERSILSGGIGPGTLVRAMERASIKLGNSTVNIPMPVSCVLFCSPLVAADWRWCTLLGIEGSGQFRFSDPTTGQQFLVSCTS